MIRRHFDNLLFVLAMAALAAMAAASFRGISEGITDAHVRYAWWGLALGALALCVSLSEVWRKESQLRLVWLDGMVLLWVAWRFFASWLSGHAVPMPQSQSYLTDALMYVSLRLVFSMRFADAFRMDTRMGLRPVEAALVLLLAFFAFKESLLGLLQLLGRTSSHHSRFSLTGSFFNPGPYGAWLMLSAAVCGSYAWRMKDRFESACRHLRKAWPFVLFYGVVALAAVLPLVLLPASLSRAAWAGLATALAVFVCRETDAVCRWRKVHARRPGMALAGGLAASLLCLALLAGAYVMKKPSADGRLFIDRISCRMIGKHPLFGCGLGGYAGAYGVAQQDFFENRLDGHLETAAALPESRVAGCPDSAFNEYMQAGAESGIPALLLMVGIMLSAIRRLLDRKPSPFAYGLVSMAVFAAFSYPFSLLPFRMWMVVMLAFAASYEDGAAGRHGLLVSLAPAVCLAALLALNGMGLPRLQQRVEAEKSWLKMRTWYSCDYFDEVADGYGDLTEALPDHPRFLFEYGRSLCMMERYGEALDVLRQGMACSSDPMFLNVAGNCCLALARISDTRDDCLEWAERAEQWYRQAFFRLPNRMYPLYLLVKLYGEFGREDDFEALKPFVVNFVPKVDSPEIHRMKSEINELSLSNTENTHP